MLKETINKLLAYLPHDRERLLRLGCTEVELSNIRDDNIVFSEQTYAYGKMNFGWIYANEVSESEIEFPPILQGKDLWVWKAFCHIKGYRDPCIEEAMQIAGVWHKKHKTTKTTIDSLLVSSDGDTFTVSTSLNIHRKVIEAYESLFFNVLDRKRDQAAMLTMIYPDSRFVETADGYSNNVSIRDLLIRTGFNQGSDYVKYFSGITSDLLNSFAAGQAATQFETQVMAMGLLLSKAGMMNSFDNTRSIGYAKQMLQAAKQGGQDAESNDIFENIGRRLRNDLVGHLQPQADERARLFSDNLEHPIIEV